MEFRLASSENTSLHAVLEQRATHTVSIVGADALLSACAELAALCTRAGDAVTMPFWLAGVLGGGLAGPTQGLLAEWDRELWACCLRTRAKVAPSSLTPLKPSRVGLEPVASAAGGPWCQRISCVRLRQNSFRVVVYA